MTFKFNNGTSDRTHWGLISQDVEAHLADLGLTSKDFAGFIKSPKTRVVDVEVLDEQTGETRTEQQEQPVEGYDSPCGTTSSYHRSWPLPSSMNSGSHNYKSQ